MPTITDNKKAYFDYNILEKFEAGIELKGFEVKSIKNGRANISGAYAIVKDEELWIINLDIPPYQSQNSIKSYDSKRTRRLLVKKQETRSLIGKIKEKGLTLLPLRLYNKNNIIKVEMGLGKSKKKEDKRETIRKREVEKEIKRFNK